MSKEVVKKKVKKTGYKKLNMKVNNLENKTPDVTTLIQTKQYSTYKQNLEKKNGEVENKIPNTSGLVTITVLNTKIREVESKISDVSGLVKKTDYNTEISDINRKYRLLLIIINLQVKYFIQKTSNFSNIANLILLHNVLTKIKKKQKN